MEKRLQTRKLVGEAVRLYRKQIGISQEKLAEKADLHPNYVGELERGLKNVSLDTLCRLASALKVRVKDLVKDI